MPVQESKKVFARLRRLIVRRSNEIVRAWLHILQNHAHDYGFSRLNS